MEIKEIDNKIVIEDANRDIVELILLARNMKLDFRVLIYLYEKYGIDIFFVFFMFSGLDIKFPSFGKLTTMIKNIDLMLHGKKTDWKYKNKIEKEVEQLRTTKVIELDIRDQTLFPFGIKGIIDDDDK